MGEDQTVITHLAAMHEGLLGLTMSITRSNSQLLKLRQAIVALTDPGERRARPNGAGAVTPRLIRKSGLGIYRGFCSSR